MENPRRWLMWKCPTPYMILSESGNKAHRNALREASREEGDG
jgi:hypothetical protein